MPCVVRKHRKVPWIMPSKLKSTPVTSSLNECYTAYKYVNKFVSIKSWITSIYPVLNKQLNCVDISFYLFVCLTNHMNNLFPTPLPTEVLGRSPSLIFGSSACGWEGREDIGRLKNPSMRLESLHAFFYLWETQIEYSGFVGVRLWVKYFFPCATANGETKILSAINRSLKLHSL